MVYNSLSLCVGGCFERKVLNLAVCLEWYTISLTYSLKIETFVKKRDKVLSVIRDQSRKLFTLK